MKCKYGILMVIILIALPLSSYGEMQQIEIPTLGWGLVFDAPVILKYKGDSNKFGFKYLGISEEGFKITILVDDKKNDSEGNTAVYKHFWPLAKKNPRIDKSTVKVLKYKKFIKVSYQIKGEHEKVGKYDIPHENYFFQFKEKWIEVHISKFPYSPEDSQIFKTFLKTLRCTRP